MRDAVIQTDDLTKTFSGGVIGVAGLNLQIQRGSVYGLIGPNGAGKTTALRLLMGLLHPDRGSAQLLGADFQKAPRSLRALVSYVSQSQQLPGWMTLAELCRYASHFYDLWDSSIAHDMARRWRLPEHQPVGQFSSGQQRKAAIFLALVPQPQILLLDEPAAGLDPLARRELVDALVEIISRGDGATILFSTHIISDIERVADHVGIIDRGRLVASSRLDALQSRIQRIQIIFPGDTPPSDFSLQGCLRVEIAGSVVTAITQSYDSGYIESLQNKPGVRVQVFPMGLEEIFIELIGHVNRGSSLTPLSN